ncbi:MAG: mechanosensitive ion channel [Saprospiraceae bacterium]|nr:mechanosensitive ion channel [Saprospiraceae bacterium]
MTDCVLRYCENRPPSTVHRPPSTVHRPIVIAILVVFSNQLTGFTVFLGVAGAGIAFALQEVIASVAGFIVIHSSNFYSIGDRVSVGGIKGDVIDIGILRTSLMEIGDWVDGDLYNGRMTRVANSFIFKEPVFNYSGDFPFLWDEVKVPIKTNSDYQYAREKFS